MDGLDLGSVTVQRIVELERWVFPPELLFPAITPELVREAREAFDDGSVDSIAAISSSASTATWSERAAA
jgi:hypothetical protein